MLSVAYHHVEFMLGGDAGCPLRVLVSAIARSEIESSDSSDEEIETPNAVLRYPWRQRFFEMILCPAIRRLSRNSLSRRKGAGIHGSTEWVIHPTDFPRLANYVDEFLATRGLGENYL